MFKITGIPYALDESGKKIFAINALAHTTYYCPFCKCKVYRKVNFKGTHFFARYANEKHIHKICETIERTGKYQSFQGFSPESIIADLCHVSPSRTNLTGKPVQTTKPTITPPRLEDDQLLPTKFTSLRQVYEVGIIDNDPYEPIDDYVMSDFYIHFKWMQQLFTKSNFKLGARILQVGIVTAIPLQKLFIFRAYDPDVFNVRFALKAATSTIYDNIEKKLFTKEIDPLTNKSRKVKRATQALIASDNWNIISKSQCTALCNQNEYCTSCHGMYFAVAVTAKQIYPIPC